MSDRAFDVVLFDLGGVLVQFGGVESMRRLSGISSDEELWRRWLTCEWVRRFESGRCGAEAFASGVVADWGLPIDGAAFLEEFGSWAGGPFEGAADLVVETRRSVSVGCLSNTNAIHSATLADWGLDRCFDVSFLSHEVGHVKPDRAIFEHVVRVLGRPPERILFLDDNVMNVDQACVVGLAAHLVRGTASARALLSGFELCDPASAYGLPYE